MRSLLRGAGPVAVLLLASGCALSSGPATPAADATSAGATIGSVSVSDVYLTSPGGARYAEGSTAVAKFTLSSSGSAWDALTSVGSDAADSVRLLELGAPRDRITVTTGGAGGVDASAQLVDLHEPLAAGARVPLTFHFAAAGSVTVDAPVH